MPTETEKAYIAGFFDGEGSFTIYRQKKRKNTYGWNLKITNTDYKVLEWIQRLYGGYIYENRKQGEHPGWSQCWYWQLTKKGEIVKLFKELYPYLRIKKDNNYYNRKK